MTDGHAAFGYHLWLAPEGDALRDLRAIVESLAERFDGPAFAPHVTLLSPLAGEPESLVQTNRSVASTLEPFHLELTVPEAGSSYFQSVYMRVADNPALTELRQATADAFEVPAGGYMPHLSLYYGDVPQERRASIVAAVPAEATGSFSVTSIQLIRADSERPADWHCVDQAPLGTGLAR